MVLRGGVAGIQVSELVDVIDGKAGLGASKKITMLFSLESNGEAVPGNQRPCGAGCLLIVTMGQSDSHAAKAVCRVRGMLAQNSKWP